MKNKKQLISAVTALTLSVSNCISIFAANFPDVPSNHWAKSSIDSAASLELMKGSLENGVTVFRPNAHVTYCESVQLIYNLLKKQNPSLTAAPETITRWVSIMQLYNIPSWVYEPLAYCLENDIVAISDLTKFISNGNLNTATREDVSVMFGKALSNYYTLSTSVNLTFKDSASISASAKIYVELLSRLGIITGNESNCFNPANNITRAEISAIITRAYNSLQNNGGTNTNNNTSAAVLNTTGTVVSFTKTNENYYTLTLRPVGNTSESLYVIKNNVPIYMDGKSADFSDITAGDIVSITYQDFTSVIKLNIDINTIPSINLTGTLENISTSYLNIKLTDKSSSEKYYLADSCTVTLDGKNSKISTLDNTLDDKNVYITITLDNNKKVTKIIAKTTVDKYDEVIENVKISSISSGAKLKIKKSSKSYALANRGYIEIDIQDGDYKSAISDFDDLKEAVEKNNAVIQADLYMYNDEIVKITGQVTELTATLQNIKTTAKTMKVKLGSGEYETYEYIKGVDISLDNRSSSISALSDALENNRYVNLELYFDEDGYIEEIIAYTSNKQTEASSKVSGEIEKLTSTYIEVTESSKSYYFADNYEIKITDGTQESNITTLEGLKKAIDYGKIFEAELTLEDSKVTKIEGYITQASGIITNIKTSKRRIELDEEFFYQYDEDVEIKIDREEITIDELEELLDDNVIVANTILFEDDYIVSIIGRTR